LFILPVASADTEEQAGNIFGVVEGFWLPDVVCELNPGWERIIFDWAQHQPTGPDDWHTLNVDDRWLTAARDCDREVVAVIKHTPNWATDGLPGAGVPRGLYLPVDDPQNLWANFMRRAADYYAPRGVKRFIIWNEPDISRETYGYEFEGSLDDYFQLLKVAHLAVKSANPDAEILLAGTTYWHDVNEGRRLYLDRLFERILQDGDAAANGYYFDVVSLHIYFRTETVYDIVHEVRALLDRYGLTGKRIWINEMNAAPTDDPLWPVVRPVYHLDLEQQADFLVQGAALGLAAGAERLAVFKFYDWSLPPGGEAFGLLRADGSRRPAFDAWKMVIRQFSGITQARLARTDRVDAVLMTRSDGQHMLVAWARTDLTARLRVASTGSEALLLDPYGHQTAIASGSGGYTLELPAARCNSVDGCAVGGRPLILLLPQRVESVQDVTQGTALELSFE
ncbi:MAG: hypothetical protein JNM70_07150, partial [Anaerolineae bacterium]|nr:hypothetical protein [Anaerolineae bacterium]